MKLVLKKVKDKKIIKLSIIVISILLILILIGVMVYKLAKFKILDVYEDKNHIYVKTTKYNNATYNLSITNDKDKIIYEKTSKSNKIDISDLNLKYNQKINIKVIADTKKDKRTSNVYQYTNRNASFNTNKNTFNGSDENIMLSIDGYSKDEKYSIELYYNNEIIKTTDEVEKDNIIPYNELKMYEGKVVAKLYNKNKRVISTFNFYINVVEVGKFEIITPEDNLTTYWDDLELNYNGGENADTLTIKFYDMDNKNKLIDTINMQFTEEKAIIPARYFKENKSYLLEIIASYKGHDEIGQTVFRVVNILEKAQVKPVYINKNNKNIKSGTKVELLTDTKDATIYYTLDGSKPDKTAYIYKEPIEITSNYNIKAYAVKNNMYDSVINTYKFNISDKNLVVYLSPSNQGANLGVSETGYSTEKNQMNLLADYLGKYLKDQGVTVYRNKPDAIGGLNTWVAESNSKKVDFHFAIHSNASIEHDKQGIEIYVDNPDSECLSIASNIYKNLYEIYPYKSSETNRGVKYARGTLGEVNEDYLKCGALIEVAFHDNYNDASWIVKNTDEIARNIANSIIDFYGV